MNCCVVPTVSRGPRPDLVAQWTSVPPVTRRSTAPATVQQGSTRHSGTMPVDVLVETTIACTPAVVSTFAADPMHAPEWYTNIRSVTWKTPPPAAIGSCIEFEAQFLGRRLVYTYEIVELVPGERLVMRTADGPLPMETTYTWGASEAGTRTTLRNRGEPSGFARVAAPLMGWAIRRATSKDLARLKGILEGAGGPTAPRHP